MKHLRPARVLSVSLALWLPYLVAWLSQGAGKHLKPGKVLSVSFGNVEKGYALATWGSLALPKRREAFEAWQDAFRQFRKRRNLGP